MSGRDFPAGGAHTDTTDGPERWAFDEACDDVYDEALVCDWCDGDGYVECDDWIQCTYYHVNEGPHQLCRCPYCNGAGYCEETAS